MLDRTAALSIVISLSLFAAYAIPQVSSRDSIINRGLSASVQKVGEMTLLSPRIASAEEGDAPQDPHPEPPLYLHPPGPMELPELQDSRSHSWSGLEVDVPDRVAVEPDVEAPEPEAEAPAGETEEPAEQEEAGEDGAPAPEEDLPAPLQRMVSDRSGVTEAVVNSRVAASPPRTGIATYYHPSLEGDRMANGRPYRSWAMTAASNMYRLGTVLRVTHQGRSVVVEITDRGAFGHALDLSSGAFKALAGSLAPGVIRITFEEIW